MSDRMTPIPFSQLVNWVVKEYRETGTVFGINSCYKATGAAGWNIFGRPLETPFGPAAGPHTQLTQNIVAAYFTGSRFFELKTVQIMDGEELSKCVNKPCIVAEDECYNCEWSTELYVPQARDEYIKAWFLLHVMSKEFGLGAQDGFQFNISVGYDLAGIKSEKIDSFIETMKNAENSECFKECKAFLLDNIDLFENFTKEDVEAIPASIISSATVSTLHGCPPQEIESIATYLIKEKHLHCLVKCNPTLLGYESARSILDGMGYDYIAFTDLHFKEDLQIEDAIPMFVRLKSLAAAFGLDFGVKITNTFPVDVTRNELPSNEMYMSGKTLYALSSEVAARLSRAFGGSLRISYSGGADYYNIDKLLGTGIYPITMATTFLKTGGYARGVQIAEKLEGTGVPYAGIDVEKLNALTLAARTDKLHVKAIKPLPSRKMDKKVPLSDCFVSPCSEGGCPIHQDIPAYLALTGAGKYAEALEVILDKNPLPFMTGTICAHPCMTKCTRNFYEESVQIRGVKLEAASKGYETVMKGLKKAEIKSKKSVAVVGGGPAGLAAAYFLARAGVDVTVFEKSEVLGGVPRNVIPGFRITAEAIQKDVDLILSMGVKAVTGREIKSLSELKTEGFGYIVLAMGACVPGDLALEEGTPLGAISFLEEFKQKDGKLDLGKNVVVIGGGNTAMDTARAAKRVPGVETVSLVYRRTVKQMPADAEELEMALEDEVLFRDLLAPVALKDGKLLCNKMQLGEADASGRQGVVPTGETAEVAADTVIAAVGEKTPSALYESWGLALGGRGRVALSECMESSERDVFVVGDGAAGPATIVQGIRDARLAADAIIERELHAKSCSDCSVPSCIVQETVGCSCGAGAAEAASENDRLGELLEAGKVTAEEICKRHGILMSAWGGDGQTHESKRCLSCAEICENCVQVCPNRANVAIAVPGKCMPQIVHVDYMCNECGNCKVFCPYASAPYLDKFTLFANEKDFEDSKNQGFMVVDAATLTFKVRYNDRVLTVKAGESCEIPADLCKIMKAVVESYSWLLMK